ncbi:MAG: hypothetical protein JW838_06145 [Spirochaetes bacterium]|nr:hypothetical protein [Spirochaetota bacterium]
MKFFEEIYAAGSVAIDRYIAHDHIAVCSSLFTSDGSMIAFGFNFEDRHPEFDNEIVERYGDHFYLEDMEVLAVRDSVQKKFPLDFFIDLADQHPADAIEIYDCPTRTNLRTGAPTDIFFTIHRTKWYW